VVFSDADVSEPGIWYCSSSDTVIKGLRALNYVEEELFKFATNKFLVLPKPLP